MMLSHSLHYAVLRVMSLSQLAIVIAGSSKHNSQGPQAQSLSESSDEASNYVDAVKQFRIEENNICYW